jgi:FkbM family methyltransferase
MQSQEECEEDHQGGIVVVLLVVHSTTSSRTTTTGAGDDIDPLLYDVTKICTSLKENLKRGWATQEGASKLHIFHALVGNESQSNVSISRPHESFGKFEQASLFPNTIGVARKPKLVTEHVPMVTLDEMVPPDLPIGLVKIDVQGFELPVVQGKWANILYFQHCGSII